MTDAERKLWQHLRKTTLPHAHFRRQATIGPYFADFACHDRRLIVEVDGGHHNEEPHLAHDQSRTAYLEAKGYRVLRFWNHDVLSNIDGVLTVIYEALRSGPMPPTPDPSPPQAGGGEQKHLD